MDTTLERHPERIAPVALPVNADISDGIDWTEEATRYHARSIVDALRQPLCAILIDCETNLTWLASEGADTDALRKILHRIRECAQWASDIVDGTDQAAVQRNLDFSVVDLRTIAASAVDLVVQESRAHTVEIVLDVTDDAAEAVGDELQLRQVLIHLLLNAIEQIDRAGSVTRLIEVRTRRRSGELIVSVEDSSSGVARGMSKDIFESFVSTKPNGMGMGLPICRAIAVSHGGSLNVESGSKGAIFNLHLPIPAMSGRMAARRIETPLPIRLARK
ncbi:sensor histidine kinase [Agrobacterium tumefaciens]|uniref:sensor histidine kinase n=1 Tax=Agrobacterium tumefaciens TaxID=358 RepID=UPI003BA3BF6C